MARARGEQIGATPFDQAIGTFCDGLGWGHVEVLHSDLGRRGGLCRLWIEHGKIYAQRVEVPRQRVAALSRQMAY